MLQYSWFEWLALFYFYGFFGWCFESTYVSICKKKFINRGFMKGPLLPLYGIGAIMMLMVSRPFQDNIFLTFIAGCLGATILEYITGVLMETLFHVRYWDYSNQKLNFHGHICLSSTVTWGFLTVFMANFFHQFVDNVLFSIHYLILFIVVISMTIYIIVDFTMAFKAALQLKSILLRLERIKEEVKEEVGHLQKRIDVTIAVLDDVKDGYVKNLKTILHSNPTLFSKKFKEGLELIKEAIEKIHKH